jgi:hypothetical protein
MLLLGALLAAMLGVGLIAASMARHWRQLRGDAALSPRFAMGLRLGGAAMLAVSLLLCLESGHPTMAALVWVMQLAAAAVLIALMLARMTPSRAPGAGSADRRRTT